MSTFPNLRFVWQWSHTYLLCISSPHAKSLHLTVLPDAADVVHLLKDSLGSAAHRHRTEFDKTEGNLQNINMSKQLLAQSGIWTSVNDRLQITFGHFLWHLMKPHFSHVFCHLLQSDVLSFLSMLVCSVHVTSIARLSILGEVSLICGSSWGFFLFFFYKMHCCQERCQWCDWPVDQLVKQQALIEVFELALLHSAAPLQLHMAIHVRVISPSTLIIPVTHMRCSINEN